MKKVSVHPRNRDSRGVVLIEFALILPLLILLIVGITECIFMFRAYSALKNVSSEAIGIGADIGAVGFVGADSFGSSSELQLVACQRLVDIARDKSIATLQDNKLFISAGIATADSCGYRIIRFKVERMSEVLGYWETDELTTTIEVSGDELTVSLTAGYVPLIASFLEEGVSSISVNNTTILWDS